MTNTRKFEIISTTYITQRDVHEIDVTIDGLPLMLIVPTSSLGAVHKIRSALNSEHEQAV